MIIMYVNIDDYYYINIMIIIISMKITDYCHLKSFNNLMSIINIHFNGYYYININDYYLY